MTRKIELRAPSDGPPVMVFLVALTVCWSCGDDATVVLADTAEREVFIEAYVELRARALAAGTTEIEGDVRDSILAAYGVTGEELLEFIDIHGEDVQFMGDLWGEIEGLLTERLEQYRAEQYDELEEN